MIRYQRRLYLFRKCSIGGFLVFNVIYVSSAYTKDICDKYLAAAQEVFADITQAVKIGTLKSLLKGPICHSGFKRLN